MVSAVFKKRSVGNAGKLALAFSIFCAQLAPINQAAYAIGELSTIYKFAKIDANRFETTKMIFNVNAGEPLILAWQAFLAPNKVLEQPREILPKETCKLISTNGEAITYGDGLSSRIWESSQANKYDFYFAPLNSAYFVINSPISTELELKCIWHKVLSEGTLKVSRYIPSGKEIYSLPKGGSIEIKAGENKFLTFQGKARKQLTFKMEATKVSLCYVTSASEIFTIAKWDNNMATMEDVEDMLDYIFRSERSMQNYYLDLTKDINNFALNTVYYSPEEGGVFDMEDNYLPNFNYEISDVPNVTPEVIDLIKKHILE